MFILKLVQENTRVPLIPSFSWAYQMLSQYLTSCEFAQFRLTRLVMGDVIDVVGLADGFYLSTALG